MELVDAIRLHLAEWETPFVEPAVFGSAEPGVIAAAIEEVCREALGERVVVAECEEARGAPFALAERRVVAASCVYSIAYTARCGHALDPGDGRSRSRLPDPPRRGRALAARCPVIAPKGAPDGGIILRPLPPRASVPYVTRAGPAAVPGRQEGSMRWMCLGVLAATALVCGCRTGDDRAHGVERDEPAPRAQSEPAGPAPAGEEPARRDAPTATPVIPVPAPAGPATPAELGAGSPGDAGAAAPHEDTGRARPPEGEPEPGTIAPPAATSGEEGARGAAPDPSSAPSRSPVEEGTRKDWRDVPPPPRDPIGPGRLPMP